MNRPPLDERPFYTVAELASIIGRHRNNTRNLLVKLNVPITYIGGRYIIYHNCLRTYAPDLYYSIMEVQHIKAVKAAHPQPQVIESDPANKESFR